MTHVDASSYSATKALKPTLVPTFGNSYGVAAIELHTSLLALVERARIKPSAAAVRTCNGILEIFGASTLITIVTRKICPHQRAVWVRIFVRHARREPEEHKESSSSRPHRHGRATPGGGHPSACGESVTERTDQTDTPPDRGTDPHTPDLLTGRFRLRISHTSQRLKCSFYIYITIAGERTPSFAGFSMNFLLSRSAIENQRISRPTGKSGRPKSASSWGSPLAAHKLNTSPCKATSSLRAIALSPACAAALEAFAA